MYPQLKRLKILKYKYFEGEELYFNKLTFIFGHSGVGKSELLNILFNIRTPGIFGTQIFNDGSKFEVEYGDNFGIMNKYDTVMFDKSEFPHESLFIHRIVENEYYWGRDDCLDSLDELRRQMIKTIILEHPICKKDEHIQVAFGKKLTDVATDTQLIVETHSDLIFNGARAGSLQDDTIKPEEIAINYITPEHKILHPQVTKYATLTSWPKGMFDATCIVLGEILRSAKRYRDEDRKKNEG